jgi:hypothetical protein
MKKEGKIAKVYRLSQARAKYGWNKSRLLKTIPPINATTAGRGIFEVPSPLNSSKTKDILDST